MQTPTTPSPAVSAATLGGTGGGSKLGKDEFVKLLMAQLGHQDPLNPLDSSAFVAQLAQFANVELLQSANGSLEGLLTSAAGEQQLSAAALVGREVVFQNDTLSLQAGQPARGLGQLAAQATEVTALVSDASGRTVRTLRLGSHPAGAFDFSWDGRDDGGLPVPPGDYRVRLVAADVHGESVAASLRGAGRVDGVSFEQGHPELLVGGARLRMGDVVEIHEQP